MKTFTLALAGFAALAAAVPVENAEADSQATATRHPLLDIIITLGPLGTLAACIGAAGDCPGTEPEEDEDNSTVAANTDGLDADVGLGSLGGLDLPDLPIPDDIPIDLSALNLDPMENSGGW